MEAMTDPERRISHAYDTVAADYAAALRHELDGKPLDRALLLAVVEMARGGQIGDLGCGPGHVTRFLADAGAAVVGSDLSATMIDLAREEHPDLEFRVASMTALPDEDASLAGAVLMYSIIHLSPAERAVAFEELARVLRPGGIAMVAFHISSEDFQPGETNRMTTWFGHSVDLEGYFLAPETVLDEIGRTGLEVVSATTRMPHTGVEFPSERAYVLAQQPGPPEPGPTLD